MICWYNFKHFRLYALSSLCISYAFQPRSSPTCYFPSRLFSDHPELQTYFKGMAKLTPEELQGSKRLSAHAHTVLLNISGIVDNLDDVETLAIILEKIGMSHKRRGIAKDSFDVSILS